jgi:hypothetical protein
MGIIKSTLGPINQKVGNLRFSSWKGKNVVARQPEGYTDANTPEQRVNRTKFGTATQYARQLTPLLRKGLKNQAIGMTVQNVFSSKLLKANLAAQELGKAEMAIAVLSQGVAKAPQVSDVQIDPTNGEWIISNTVNSNGTSGLASDQLQLALLDTSSQKVVLLENIMPRSQNTATAVNPDLIGFNVNETVSLSFYTRPGTNVVSDTLYTEPSIL